MSISGWSKQRTLGYNFRPRKDYQFLIEELRETRFWGTYFEIVEIVPAIENAYALYYAVEPITNHS
jgi:hypothetical protein